MKNTNRRTLMECRNDFCKTVKKNVSPRTVGEYTGRFFIWAVFFTAFIFSLAFLISANAGISTLDSFAQPLRHLFGADHTIYGKAFLIPISSIMITTAIIISYKRNKKIRIDYVLAYIPIISLGFILDEIMKIDFFNTLLINSSGSNQDIPFVEEPIRILWGLIGFVMFAVSLGGMAPMKIAPNSFVIFVDEISKATNKSYKATQWTIDILLIALGAIIMSIAVSAHTDPSNWYELFKIIGPITLVILLGQGIVINFVMKKTDYIVNKKLFTVTGVETHK